MGSYIDELNLVFLIQDSKNPELEGLLALLLNSKAAYVREVTVRALKTLGGKNALAHIAPLLKDTDYEVRIAALFALKDLGQQELARELFLDGHWKVRDVAKNVFYGTPTIPNGWWM